MMTRYRRDVELQKAMGFNGARKHQKIEEPALPLSGPTRSGCWSGRRCRAPTGSPRTSIERLTREWTDGDRARRQPPVHHRLGAVQRILNPGRRTSART